jgi:hypothetical protein
VYATLAALVAGATGYAVAHAKARSALSAADEREKALQSAHATGETASRKANEKLSTRVRLLEARRTLNGALLAVEERNFGTAQERLRAAGNAQLKDAGEDTALKQAAERTHAFRIGVAEDIGEQRDRLVALSREVDQALDATELKKP